MRTKNWHDILESVTDTTRKLEAARGRLETAKAVIADKQAELVAITESVALLEKKLADELRPIESVERVRGLLSDIASGESMRHIEHPESAGTQQEHEFICNVCKKRSFGSNNKSSQHEFSCPVGVAQRALEILESIK